MNKGPGGWWWGGESSKFWEWKEGQDGWRTVRERERESMEEEEVGEETRKGRVTGAE